jgi:endonuclease YncB( thermonuclease family)
VPVELVQVRHALDSLPANGENMRTLLLGAILAAAPAFAAPWVVEGRVVGIISDGDTITVLDSEKKQHKVRINGIDAPEKGQAFGERSRQNLAQMAHGKDARIECHKTDRFGREACKVWVQPQDCPRCDKTLDVGLAQISAQTQRRG